MQSSNRNPLQPWSVLPCPNCKAEHPVTYPNDLFGYVECPHSLFKYVVIVIGRPVVGAVYYKGEEMPPKISARAILSVADVRKIRKMYAASGISQKKLATKFGVSQPTIHNIIHRKVYRQVL